VSQTEQTVNERSTVHSTFVIERIYAASPRLVFDAWADPAAKAKWFGPPEKPEGSYSLDFREGGREHLVGPMPDNGPVYAFDAVYQDIVPGSGSSTPTTCTAARTASPSRSLPSRSR
jgi:uncharacterized protein YndB with AHSA1/START domain